MSFLHRVAGRFLRDRVRSSVTREELGVEPLLLHIERGQLRWLGHLFRMPPGRLPEEVFRACPTGKRLRGRPRTCWRDYVFWLAWERLGVPPEELEEVSGEREVWASLLRLLPPLRQTEILKKDFRSLVEKVRTTSPTTRIIVSGPLPTFQRGIERLPFSDCLLDYCFSVADSLLVHDYAFCSPPIAGSANGSGLFRRQRRGVTEYLADHGPSEAARDYCAARRAHPRLSGSAGGAE
ncbi:hypothetical protein QTP70_016699 [Hemibagrus guttatus]|uniref:Uncharacterized protein n=1 Tax=Hemibagrus guttatus TaxID=175788 RepID=A0AAE0RL99_9TELE|nr:hypothetical protein QTP70_016699 [Hemibagrus guttatus]